MGWDGTGTGTDTDTDAGRSDPEGREREGGGASTPIVLWGASLLLVVFCPTEGVSLLL